jgi:hypothetical protein
MRDLLDLLKELGFKEDGPEAIKLALVRHSRKATLQKISPAEPEQLSFDLNEETVVPAPPFKKISQT